ncbi:MAG: hypothetical protein WCT24_00715 [Patescibacteria group bacterium]
MQLLRFGSTLDIYHTILERAWKIARQHKELWVFAIFASLLNSGAVFQQVLNIFWRLEPANEMGTAMKQVLVDQFPWILEWAQQLMVEDSWRTILSIVLGVAAIALVIVCSLIAQQVLVKGVYRASVMQTHLSWRELLAGVHHLHLFRLAGVNLSVIIILVLLVLGASFPLGWLLETNPDAHMLIFAAFYTLLIPLFLIINLFGMLLIVDIVHAGKSIVDALKDTSRLLRHHWLLAIELGLLLYLLNLVVAFVGILILFVLYIPLGLLSAVLIAWGVGAGSTIFSILGFLLIVTAGLLYTAFITTFNYAVWVECAQRLRFIKWHPALEHLSRKFFSLFSRT